METREQLSKDKPSHNYLFNVILMLMNFISTMGLDFVTVRNFFAAILMGVILQFMAICQEIWRLLAFCQEVGDLDRKHVAISGCDSGFGYMLALRLLERGLTVHAGCLTEKGMGTLKKEARSHNKYSGHLYTILLDVTSKASVVDFKESVEQNLPPEGLWAVVCNAGVMGPRGPDAWNSVEDFTSVLNVNLHGQIRMIHEFRTLLSRQEQECRLVFMCSMFGHYVGPYCIPYVVSKHAVLAYAECLRTELVSTKLRVITICPGMFPTALTFDFRRHYLTKWNQLSDVTKEQYGETRAGDALPAKAEQQFDYIQRCIKILSHDNSRVELVIDTYENAILHKRPKVNYFIGADTIFLRVVEKLGARVKLLFATLSRKVLGDSFD